MKNPQPFSRFTWCFIGLVVGLVSMFMYQVAVRAQYAREDSDASLDYYLWRQAEDSTRLESSPVIIYAWSRYLDNIERLRGRSQRFWARTESPFVLMSGHGCMAKIYAQLGDTNLSEEHLAQALRYAQATGRYPTVTNQAMLWDFLDQHYGKIGK
jgi:hypothetical protein